MSDGERPVTYESTSIAAFTVLSVLLEKLVQQRVLTQDDVRAVLDGSIRLNAEAVPTVSGRQNEDAIYLIQKFRESIEGEWAKRSAE